MADDIDEPRNGGEPGPATISARQRSASISPQKKRRIVDLTNARENDSLIKRMGGPSAGKAGLTKDQEEINRTIYEASKGSKYFENERRNDERITKKVETMLERLDERLRAVPEGSHEWAAIEKRAEAIAAKVELERRLDRKIVHLDLDMFYAAVELKRDPSLKGKCFGVGGGVLVTASYEARKFGVRSGMAGHIAIALCPHLITVPANMNLYVETSREIMAIFRRFDSNLAQASLDEAYLDITDYCQANAIDVDEAVSELRRQVREETGLTVSAGVASNKMLAKIGSDKNKPDGHFILPPERGACIDFMKDLSIRKVPGVGRVTERMLQALGVETCGDIWDLRVRIALVLGDTELAWLLHYNLGIGSSVVEPSKREERKTVGREHTFKPTSDPDRLFELLRSSAESVEEDLKQLDFIGKKVTLTCKHDNFQRFTRDQTLDRYVQTADEIFGVTKALLEHELRVQNGLTLRLIGARVGTLKDIRKPKDGGPLKKLWSKTGEQQTSPKRKRIQRDLSGLGGADASSGDNDSGADEDEEARQLRWALAASLEDVRQSSQEFKASLPPDEGSGDPATGDDEDDAWILGAEPTERSASNFAEALRQATPEVMHPIKPKAKSQSTTPLRPDSLEVFPLEGDRDRKSRSPTTAPRPSPIPPASAPADKDLVCPICSRAVPVRFGSTLTGRNEQLNKHIDACLNGTADVAEESRTVSPTKESNAVAKKKQRFGDGGGLGNGAVGKKQKGALHRFFGGGGASK